MKKKNVGLASMQHYYVILVLVASSPLKVPARKGALGYSEFGQKQQLCSCQLISYAKKLILICNACYGFVGCLILILAIVLYYIYRLDRHLTPINNE